MADRKEPKVGTMGPKPKGTLDVYMPKDPASTPEKKKEPDADTSGVTNPNRPAYKREKAAGLKAGGLVRGCGKAVKGHGKGKIY